MDSFTANKILAHPDLFSGADYEQAVNTMQAQMRAAVDQDFLNHDKLRSGKMIARDARPWKLKTAAILIGALMTVGVVAFALQRTADNLVHDLLRIEDLGVRN